jgi:hypothetical protein
MHLRRLHGRQRIHRALVLQRTTPARAVACEGLLWGAFLVSARLKSSRAVPHKQSMACCSYCHAG